MAQRDDMELMQHLDGELPAELSELSEDDQLVLRSLEQVGDAVRTHLELAADDVDDKLDAMWSTLERRIVANGANSAVEAASPVPAARKPAAASEESPGLFARIGKWLDDHRGHVFTGAIAAAAAAVLVIALRPPDTVVKREIVRVPVKSDPTQPVQSFARSEPAVVETLDVSEGSGTILTIPGEEGENPTTVIWVSRDEMEGPI